MKIAVIKNILLGAASVLVLAQAEARSFYKANFKISVQYTNIEIGKTDLLNDLKATVRYSDDHDYCQVVVGSDVFKCLTYHPDNQPEQVMITMDRGEAGRAVLAALTHHKVPSSILEKFTRLAIYLDDTINIEWQGSDFFQQIHDEQMEAFHIWLFDMSEGVNY